MEQNRDLITETVVLFYIFLAPSRGVINARQALWNFILGKVKHALGNRFEAFFAACERPPNLDCHADVPGDVIAQYQAQLEEQGILVQFKRLLEGNPPSQAAAIDSPQDADGKLQGNLRAVVGEARRGCVNIVTANSGNTCLNSNVHVDLLPKSANPSEMAPRHARYKFSRQVGVCHKTWESILGNQNSNVRKARPEISRDIFGLDALFSPWQFPPFPCQYARRDPPVNRGSKDPSFSWGLNAGEGGRVDPIMRCKKAIDNQGNSLQYCKFPCFTPGRAEGKSSRSSKSACLNTCSPMQAMRPTETISRRVTWSKIAKRERSPFYTPSDLLLSRSNLDHACSGVRGGTDRILGGNSCLNHPQSSRAFPSRNLVKDILKKPTSVITTK